MATKQQDTLLLTATKGVKSQIIKEGIAATLAMEGKRLKKETQWKGYYFQLRSRDGYKAKPIWPEGKKL